MELRHIQNQLPWTIKYSRDFRANPQGHKDFTHALIHAQKAAGKLCELVDDLDHRRESDVQPAKYIADLVVCALRMANTLPGGRIDLQAAVIFRIEDKNEAQLERSPYSVENLIAQISRLNEQLNKAHQRRRLGMLPADGIPHSIEMRVENTDQVIVYDRRK